MSSQQERLQQSLNKMQKSKGSLKQQTHKYEQKLMGFEDVNVSRKPKTPVPTPPPSPHKEGKKRKPKAPKAPKAKRGPNKWITALKKWNTEKGGAWCVPRKGSKEYDEVKKFM